MSAPEFYIDHEIRVRLLEKTVNDIKKIGIWIIATMIIGIALPVSLHAYGLV